MNIGNTDCAKLAERVVELLGDWHVVGELEAWCARIARADGLCLWITEAETRGRTAAKPMVTVSFDFHASLNGLNKGYVSVQDDDTRSINCQTDPRSVASAIQSRLLPTVEQTYFRLKTKCEKCERDAQHRRQVLADLAAAIGERVRGGDDAAMSGDREGYVIYKRGAAFQLEIRYTGYENSFHLKGYSNYIPIDLMCRLIPVIEQWWSEQEEYTS